MSDSVVDAIAAAVEQRHADRFERINERLAAIERAIAAGAMPERPLSRAKLAEALDCSERQIDHLRQAPGFPAHRLGEAPRFFLSEVSAWMRARSARDAGGGGP